MTVRLGFLSRACVALLMLACSWAWAERTPRVENHIIIQTSPLAGFQYYAGRALFPLMRVGDRLDLVREPENAFDPRAVRVDWRGVQIGHVPRIENLDLARLIDRGAPLEARILHLEDSRDPWQRLLFEVIVVEPGR
ncbi:MAG: HIRAN protein [Betaproteobacteria bacterium]|nr:MAG: HIRAN protein [Betaproteobacteria bacterium]